MPTAPTTSTTPTKLRARNLGRVAIGGSLLAASGGGTLALLQSPASATGATFTVTNTNDSGAGSLRAAITSANADSVSDTIVFDPSVFDGITPRTINLVTRLEVTEAVSIVGPGANALSINGGGTNQVFYFYSHGSGAASLSGVTITNAGNASAIVVWDTDFTLDNVTITGSNVVDSTLNFIDNASVGGSSTLTVSNSTFSNNTASGNINNSGGAICAGVDAASTINISNTTFTNNTNQTRPGGALGLRGSGDVTITGSTFTGNSSTQSNPGAGAIFVTNTGNFSISNSTLDSNHANNNRGGAIFFASSGGVGKTTTIANTTISNNTAATASGLYFRTSSAVSINNSTITGNHTSVGGAGAIMVAETGSLAINQSTITNNSAAGTNATTSGGGGILTSGVGVLNLSGTILSGNSSGVSSKADLALYNTQSLSNVTATSSLLGTIDPGATIVSINNVMSTTPMLGALANNGGSTQTMLPLTGSPAIDAGPNPVASFTGNGFDQRGTPNVRVANGIADIGAVEVQSGAPPTSSSSTTASTTTTTSSTTSSTTSTGAGADDNSPSADPNSSLPATGSDSLPLVAVGSGALLLGAGAAGFAASRRNSQLR